MLLEDPRHVGSRAPGIGRRLWHRSLRNCGVGERWDHGDCSNLDAYVLADDKPARRLTNSPRSPPARGHATPACYSAGGVYGRSRTGCCVRPGEAAGERRHACPRVVVQKETGPQCCRPVARSRKRLLLVIVDRLARCQRPALTVLILAERVRAHEQVRRGRREARHDLVDVVRGSVAALAGITRLDEFLPFRRMRRVAIGAAQYVLRVVRRLDVILILLTPTLRISTNRKHSTAVARLECDTRASSARPRMLSRRAASPFSGCRLAWQIVARQFAASSAFC